MSNCVAWERSMRNNLRAKNKADFLDGTIDKPADGTPEAALWVRVNSTLVAWIYGTLDPSVRSSVTQPDDVKDMWNDLKERFSIGNGPRIHELTVQLSECRQRNLTVVAYYGELKKLWDELAGYSMVSTCTCDAAKEIAKEKEDAKVHKFLIGLDTKLYGNVVSNILMIEPLPSLNTVFAKVVTEERHHTLARAQEARPDVVGFAAQGITRNQAYGRGGEKQKSSDTCTHCGKPGHDKDSCFKIVGFPEWFYLKRPWCQ